MRFLTIFHPEASEEGGTPSPEHVAAPSKEALVEACKEFLEVAGDGTVEIRQILEFAPVPA